jgi:DNA-binding XRE family transcriptional regulator
MQEHTKKHPTKLSDLMVTVSQGGKKISVIHILDSAGPVVLKMLRSVAEPTIPYRQTSLAAEFGRGPGGAPAAVLRGLRERDGLTQGQLGELLKIKARHISDYERGKRPISLRLARKLATVFGSHYNLFIMP